MNLMTKLADVGRSPGDPKVVRTGPGSLGTADRLARGLGWFSLGLGMAELLAARRIARGLGMEGKEVLIRACGAREVAAGVMSLSVDSTPGIANRLVGDGIDLATLLALRGGAGKKTGNVDLALAAVVGIGVLDLVCHQALRARHGRIAGDWRDYRDRSGFPRGVDASRGLARGDAETQPG